MTATFQPASIELRREQPADYSLTEHVVREAFWNHYCPGATEHYLLHVMRESPRFVPELDWVAWQDGRIVGQVVYMQSLIRTDAGTVCPTLTLGPIAVLPTHQRQGIGRKLIAHSREVARELGYRAILLCGDPAYYRRIGFRPAQAYGIRTTEGMYMEALHACELYEGALTGAKGCYEEDAVYQVDAAAVAAFDRQFSPKPLLTDTPSQRRFAEVVRMQCKA